MTPEGSSSNVSLWRRTGKGGGRRRRQETSLARSWFGRRCGAEHRLNRPPFAPGATAFGEEVGAHVVAY